MEDNQGSIAIEKNPIVHTHTKHNDIRYYYIREAVEDKVIILQYCPSQEIIANILTKPLSEGQFTTSHGHEHTSSQSGN